MKFRVCVQFVVERPGGHVVKQVPTFILDGDVHGLFIPEDAERFAIRMTRDMLGNQDLRVTADAVKED